MFLIYRNSFWVGEEQKLQPICIGISILNQVQFSFSKFLLKLLEDIRAFEQEPTSRSHSIGVFPASSPTRRLASKLQISRAMSMESGFAFLSETSIEPALWFSECIYLTFSFPSGVIAAIPLLWQCRKSCDSIIVMVVVQDLKSQLISFLFSCHSLKFAPSLHSTSVFTLP